MGETAICNRCRHLRESTGSDEVRTFYMACGWPLPAVPRVMNWPPLVGSEAGRLITRAALKDRSPWPGYLDTCPTFEEAPHDALLEVRHG